MANGFANETAAEDWPIDKFRTKGLEVMADGYIAYLADVRSTVISRIEGLNALRDAMPLGWTLERSIIDGLTGSAIPTLVQLRDDLTDRV